MIIIKMSLPSVQLFGIFMVFKTNWEEVLLLVSGWLILKVTRWKN